MNEPLRAPFPWFGGKSRAAELVWSRLGDVPNYVEPFAGSIAVLLRRPHRPRIETVNDADCFIANFWRAVHSDPYAVANYADWPVNEADLHARHRWLCAHTGFRDQMLTDPEFFDAKIAGWWVWGISQWIGSGWCANPEWTGRGQGGRAPRGINTLDARRPHSHNMGVFTAGCLKPIETKHRRPVINYGGRGVSAALAHKKPKTGRPSGLEHIAAPGKRPQLTGNGPHGVQSISVPLIEWMNALCDRLRPVRVICGDWKRVITPSCTWKVGGRTLCGVFLDPPYSHEVRDRLLYNVDRDVAGEVRQWAIENGNNKLLRIALCGLAGEHDMPTDWEAATWIAPRGMAKNPSRKEVIWFSPHCLKSRSLFEKDDVNADDHVAA